MIFNSTDPNSRPIRGVLPCIAWGCLFLLVWLGSVEPASAEFFTFSTAPQPAIPVLGNGVTVTLTSASVNTPGDNLDATIPDGTDIVFGNIAVSGLIQGTALQAVSIPYSFHVSLTDYSTGTSSVPTGPPVDFVVSGLLTGTVGPNKKVNITNAYSQSSIVEPVGVSTYLMEFFSFVAPGVANSGAFGAHLVVTVPEPSTIALLSLGALALATPAFRRWRRKTPRLSG